MHFYDQVWFWTGVIGLAGSWGGIFIKELIAGRTQVRLERLKIHETDILKAYRSLYAFISSAYTSLYPPNDPIKDFKDLMKFSYFKNVKPNKLFYDASIREQLAILESQYDCLLDSDLIPQKPFDDFYDKDIGKILQHLEKMVEKKSDRALHHER